MSLDPLLKKSFPLVAGGLVAAIAFFQAQAMNELFGGWLAGQAPAVVPGPPKPDVDALRARLRGADSEAVSADPILERNVFDALTGNLLAKPLDLSGAEGGPAQGPDLSDPLQAGVCSDLTVAIVTQSSDPTWSVAGVRGPGEELAHLRRVGDRVGEKELVYIGYNRARSSPAVWFLESNSLCQALVFAPGGGEEKPSAKAAESSAPKASTERSSGRDGLPEDIKRGIHKISDTEFNVDRSVVDKVLSPENQALLMKQVRIAPETKNGQVVGVRLLGVRSNSLLGELGLKSGDVLENINGFEMGSPEKALEAYARLRTADKLSLKVKRRGAGVGIDLNIK